MAWTKERRNGFLVCWREAETGKDRSEFVRFESVGSLSDFDAGEPLTAKQVRQRARQAAEALAQRMKAKERRSMTALNRVLRAAERRGDTVPPLFGPETAPEYIFETY